MKKIFFLLNSMDEYDFEEYVNKYLDNIKVVVGDSLPADYDKYDLVILWSYKKIIKGLSCKNNIIIFHSSDLPDGKGWAPIYNALFNELEYYTISGIILADDVDAGDIVVKARFKIKDNYTAAPIRQWDQEINILLAGKILDRFDGVEIRGKKQEGEGSFYPRRNPADNEIDVNKKLSSVIKHLRACEKHHPAFFMQNNTKYHISIEPELKPAFPDDLEITFYDQS